MTPGANHPQRAPRANETSWLERLESHGAEYGFHRQLDTHHGALFTEDDETLLVTFELLDDFRDGPAPQLPTGLSVAGREGWSHLCLYSDGATFFRSDSVYAFFDDLVDEGFFDRFDRVLFYGAGPCGYAAAAFSVTAPGATVLLIRPLATLAADLTGWDRRHPAMRRTDFKDRYGYAPDMLEAAERVILIHDPLVAEDAMHATLFGRSDVLRLDCPHLGKTPEKDFQEMDILVPLLRAAGRSSFDASLFFRLYRARRNHKPYLQRVQSELEARGRQGLRNFWSHAAAERLEASGTPENTQKSA